MLLTSDGVHLLHPEDEVGDEHLVLGELVEHLHELIHFQHEGLIGKDRQHHLGEIKNIIKAMISVCRVHTNFPTTLKLILYSPIICLSEYSGYRLKRI